MMKRNIYMVDNSDYVIAVWNGKPKKPAITVEYGGKKLEAGKDYVVDGYINNVGITNAGSVVVRGIGDEWGGVYAFDQWVEDEGFATYLKFEIKPKGTELKQLKGAKKAINVTWNKQATKMPKKRIAGYQVQVSKSSLFKKGQTRTLTVKNYRRTSVKISKLAGKKKHYVRVRTYYNASSSKLYDNYIYSKWSKSKSVQTL